VSAATTAAPAVWVPARINAAVKGRLGPRAKRDRRVDAVVLEGTPFAVHPSLSPPPSQYWTVTHLPTGYALVQYARDETAARAAAVLLARVAIDWPALRPETSAAAFRALPERVRMRITAIGRRAVLW
jgi:hypothetical protein